jgi:hypothetical protein
MELQSTYIGGATPFPDPTVRRDDLVHHFITIPEDLMGLGATPTMGQVKDFCAHVVRVLSSVPGVALCRVQNAGDGPGYELAAFCVYLPLGLIPAAHRDVLAQIIGALARYGWLRGDSAAILRRAMRGGS